MRPTDEDIKLLAVSLATIGAAEATEEVLKIAARKEKKIDEHRETIPISSQADIEEALRIISWLSTDGDKLLYTLFCLQFHNETTDRFISLGLKRKLQFHEEKGLWQVFANIELPFVGEGVKLLDWETTGDGSSSFGYIYRTECRPFGLKEKLSRFAEVLWNRTLMSAPVKKRR